MTAQVRPLIALRWRMLRSGRARRGFIALAALIPALCLIAAVVGATAPRDRTFDVLLLAPSAYLTVALLTLLGPLVAGGGQEMFPTGQLDAFPVTSRTHFLASLVLTPLNLAWTTQLVALVGLTTFVSDQGPGIALSVLTCLIFLAAVTLAGQALAWYVVGLRQRAWARRASWCLAFALIAAGAVIALTGHLSTVLNHSPTTWVVIGGAQRSSRGRGWLPQLGHRHVDAGGRSVGRLPARPAGVHLEPAAAHGGRRGLRHRDGTSTRAVAVGTARTPCRRPGQRLALVLAASRAARARHPARGRRRPGRPRLALAGDAARPGRRRSGAAVRGERRSASTAPVPCGLPRCRAMPVCCSAPRHWSSGRCAWSPSRSHSSPARLGPVDRPPRRKGSRWSVARSFRWPGSSRRA